ncbi:unnamed protein product [Arctogadus glacialis]
MYCVFIILSVGLNNDSKCKKYLWKKFGTIRDGSKCFSGRFRDVSGTFPGRWLKKVNFNPCRPPSYVGTLRRSLDQLEETLNMEMKKLPDDAELKWVQKYEVDVTLDPDTAHRWLILSEDGKQVHDNGGVWKTLPDNPKRFTSYPFVLTRQSFSSGRFYFEVLVKDMTEWGLGVVRESIDRTGGPEGTPETGYWALWYHKDVFLFRDNADVLLPLRAGLQKVGVFVDYDEGLVSFYDVEARVHIYSATGCTFTEPLYPFLCPWLNSAPLIISPVNQTD